MCDIWLAIDYLNSNAAVLNMLIISFDRYFSVTRPLTYRAKRTTKHAILMISFAWILSLTIWTPAIFTYPYYKGRTVQGTDKCEIEFVKANTYLTFVTAILAFYIPVAIMIYLYWRIWLETKKRYRDLTTLFLVSGVGAAAPRPPNRPIISAITAGSSSNSNNNNNTNNSSNSLAPVPACQDGRRLANIAASASAKSHLFGRTVGSKKTHGNNSSNLSAAPSRKSQLKAKSSLKLAPTAGAASEKGELSSSPKQVGGDRTNVDMKRGGGGASTSDRIASEEDDFLIGVESKTSGTALKGAAAPLGAPTSKEVHSQHPSSTQELGTSDDKQHAVSLLLYNQSRDQSSSAAPGENAGAAPAAKSKHSAPASTSLTKHCKCAAATTSKCCYINSSCAAPATLATLSRQIACKVTPTRCPLIVDNCKACQEYIRQHSRAAAAHSGDKKVRNFCDGEQLTTSSSKTNAAPSACCSSCCCPCTANSSQLACRHSPPSAPCDSAVPFSSNNESFNEASSQAQKQADDNKQNKRTQRSSSKMASCSCSTGVTTMPSCCQKASANNANSRSKLALGLVGQSGQPTRDQSKAPSTSAVGNSSSKSIYQLISDASGPPQRVKIHPKLSGDSSPPTAPADASLHQLDVDAEAPIEEDSRLVPERAQQEGQPPPLGDREEQRESKSDDVSEQQAAAAAAEQKRLVDVATSPINFSSPLGERADSKIISDFQLEPDEDSFEQEDFETRIVSYGDRLRFESNDPKLIRAASSGSSRGPISSHHHTSSAPTQRPAAAAALQRIDTDGGSRAAATTSDRCCCVEVISAHDAECKFCRPITKPDQHFGQHQRQPIASGADTSPTAAPSGRLVDGHLHQQQHQQCSEHHHGIGRGGHAHHHHRTIAYHGHQHHGHHHHGHHSHNHRSHGHYYHHHQHHHHHHHGGHYKRDPSCQLAAASKHKLKSECKACLVRVPKMTMHGGGSKMIEMSTPAETITKNVAAASNLGQDADEGQTAALDRAAETSGSLPILGVLQQMSPDRQAKLRAASGAREDATGSKSSGNGAKYKKLSQKLTFSDILIEERAPSMVGRGSNKFSPRSHKHQQASSSCTNRDAGARQVKIMPKWTGALSKSQRAEKLRNLYDDRDDEGSDRGALAEGSEGDGHRRWFKSAYSNLVNWHFVSSLPQIGVLMPCKRANRNRYRANESTHQDGNGGYRDGNEHDDADGDDDNEDQEAESDNDDRDANSDGGNEERPGCADAELGAPTRERRHGAKILDTICCSAKPLIKRFSSNDSSSYNDTTTVGTHQKGAKLSLPTATGSSNVQQSRLISSDTRHQQGQQRHGSSHYNNSSSKSSSSASQSNQHQHNHHHPIQPKSERKAAKTLSTLLLVFIVTWLPYNVLVLIKTLSGGEDQVPEKIWNFSYYLCYINSTINPLCYALCNAQFRRTYMRILKCKLSNEHNSTRRLVPIQSSSTWNKDLRLNSTSNLECGNSTSQTNSSGAANNQQSQQEVGSGRKRKQPRKSK